MRRYKVSVPWRDQSAFGYKIKRATVTVDAEDQASAFKAAYKKRNAKHPNTLPHAAGQEYKVLEVRELP